MQQILCIRSYNDLISIPSRYNELLQSVVAAAHIIVVTSVAEAPAEALAEALSYQDPKAIYQRYVARTSPLLG